MHSMPASASRALARIRRHAREIVAARVRVGRELPARAPTCRRTRACRRRGRAPPGGCAAARSRARRPARPCRRACGRSSARRRSPSSRTSRTCRRGRRSGRRAWDRAARWMYVTTSSTGLALAPRHFEGLEAAVLAAAPDRDAQRVAHRSWMRQPSTSAARKSVSARRASRASGPSPASDLMRGLHADRRDRRHEEPPRHLVAQLGHRLRDESRAVDRRRGWRTPPRTTAGAAPSARPRLPRTCSATPITRGTPAAASPRAAASRSSAVSPVSCDIE